MSLKIKLHNVVFAIIVILMANISFASTPITTDSRIRTIVYNENEVFKLTTSYGYQSSIEFSPDERVKTISVGDAVPFKLTPQKNRVFIKANQNNRLTNLTILTDKRTYHFELSSHVKSEDDIIYVMRFYYPEDGFHDKRTAENTPTKKTVRGVSRHRQSINKSVKKAVKGSIADKFNYNYTMAGNSPLKPSKLFDNGKSTFIKLSSGKTPIVKQITASGDERRLETRKTGGFLMFNNVVGKFALYYPNEVICVFNDKISPAKMASTPNMPQMPAALMGMPTGNGYGGGNRQEDITRSMLPESRQEMMQILNARRTGGGVAPPSAEEFFKKHQY